MWCFFIKKKMLIVFNLFTYVFIYFKNDIFKKYKYIIIKIMNQKCFFNFFNSIFTFYFIFKK